jgi:hypothetical protein
MFQAMKATHARGMWELQSHSMVSDRSLGVVMLLAEFQLADGVTGTAEVCQLHLGIFA